MPECLKVFFLSCNRTAWLAALPALIIVHYAGAQLSSSTLRLNPGSGDTTVHDSLQQPVDYQARLASFIGETAFRDTVFASFKYGIAELRIKSYKSAKQHLLVSATACSTLAAATYDLIAEAELGQGHIDSALAWFRTAHDHYLPQRYEADLEKRISAVIDSNHIDTATLRWTAPWYRPGISRVAEQRRLIVDSLSGAHSWAAFDSMAKIMLDSAAVPPPSCDVANAVSAANAPDSALSTVTLFRLSAALFNCRAFSDASAWFEKAAGRKDFDSLIPPAAGLYLRGMFAYRLGNDQGAIDWLTRYAAANTPPPEIVIALARAYRTIKNQKESDRWYDKYLTLYPRDSRTQEILWSRAWQNEDADHYTAARAGYRKLIARFPRGTRAKEAQFRTGFCFVRESSLDSAIAVFGTFLDKYRDDGFANQVRFWKSYCKMKIGEPDSARQGLAAIIENDPFGYYSWRSRELLAVMGDTGARIELDTANDFASTRRFLDSLTADPVKALQPQDSLMLKTGLFLAAAGRTDRAKFYFGFLEAEYPSNLRAQLDYATLYALVNDPSSSYRLGRKLFWRLPTANRARPSLPVMAMLFPPWYGDFVRKNAEFRQLDPFLVWAVMRQESIFNASIISPAGAVGLMQIMPSTGKVIAKALGENYSPDSLNNPESNVRFGAYYIKELLDEFDGNIVLAAASYNGGPFNAKKWLSLNRGDGFNMFVEGIGFSETRDYVKKVLANYWTYTLLARKGAYDKKYAPWLTVR